MDQEMELAPRLTEQAGKQRYKDSADKGNAAARHELLNACLLYTSREAQTAFDTSQAAFSLSASERSDSFSLAASAPDKTRRTW